MSTNPSNIRLSAVEQRLLSALAERHRDPYTAAAAVMFDVAEDHVTDEQRLAAKAELYRTLYSG